MASCPRRRPAADFYDTDDEFNPPRRHSNSWLSYSRSPPPTPPRGRGRWSPLDFDPSETPRRPISPEFNSPPRSRIFSPKTSTISAHCPPCPPCPACPPCPEASRLRGEEAPLPPFVFDPDCPSRSPKMSSSRRRNKNQSAFRNFEDNQDGWEDESGEWEDESGWEEDTYNKSNSYSSRSMPSGVYGALNESTPARFKSQSGGWETFDDDDDDSFPNYEMDPEAWETFDESIMCPDNKEDSGGRADDAAIYRQELPEDENYWKTPRRQVDLKQYAPRRIDPEWTPKARMERRSARDPGLAIPRRLADEIDAMESQCQVKSPRKRAERAPSSPRRRS